MAKKPEPKLSATENVITLKVTLRGVKPPVWRRLVMPGLMTLRDLHLAIQAAMGWGNYHLHVFVIGGEEFGDLDHDDGFSDEDLPTLNALLLSHCIVFRYTYDFGDNWEHTIAFEKSEAAVEGQFYPLCTGGKRNCPPEDCGGFPGYAEMLAALADPAHPAHAQMTEWIGGKFDPNAFDLARANVRLAERFKRE